MTMGKGRRRGQNEFSLRMSSSLSKKWVCVLQKTYLGFFSLNGLLILLWVVRVYIVWVRGKKVTLKNPPSKAFREYLARRPYPQDTCKILQAGMTLQLSACASHMSLLQVSFLLASREIHLFFNSCSILHQLNTKPNTIKSHKIPGTKLKQLQHFLP